MAGEPSRSVISGTRRRATRVLDWVRRRRRRVREAHGLVLMYHRIASVAVDPWRLAVRPDHFEDQLQLLRRHADIVPLSVLRDHLRRGRRSRPAVAITFDDGYVDNLTAAKPLLERFEAPATVFVATGFVGRTEPFWWDRLASACLNVDSLPERLKLNIGPEQFVVDDPDLAAAAATGRLARLRLHSRLWQRLVRLAEPLRTQALVEIVNWSGMAPDADGVTRPMDERELRRLIDGGLVDLGAHTVTHPLLSLLPPAERVLEIEQSRRACTKLIGRPPAAFAFPNGDFDEECIGLVRRSGFELACNSRPELVWESDDACRMTRISVPDVDGPRLLRELRLKWLP